MHIYGFVIDREGRASNSTYIGVGRLNHYEERGRYIPINKAWNEFVEIASEVNEPEQDTMQPESDAKVSKIDIFADMPKQSPPE